MSEFKRKTQSGGFEAGEKSFKAQESAETPPDFSALEAESGFSADQVEQPVELPRPVVEPEPAMPIKRPSRPAEKAFPAQPAEETPKKRYYSPGEVMKKKGCIGCGGMMLAFPVLLASVILIITLL